MKLSQSDQIEFPELQALPAALSDRLSGHLHADHWMGLALHLPLRFEDHETLAAMDRLQVRDKVNLTATVTGQEVAHRPRKQLKVWVEDQGVNLLLRWVHFYPGQADRMPVGCRLKITGQVRQGYGILEMVHPQVKRLTASEEADLESQRPISKQPADPECRLMPVYPSHSGISQKDWQHWNKRLPAAVFEDTLPTKLCEVFQLMPWGEALRTLHGQALPEEADSLNSRTHPAWTRIKLDELLNQQLLLREYRHQRLQESAIPLNTGPINLQSKLAEKLGFKLTNAQTRAVDEICKDLQQPHPMQRLLQGDVGSGKTLVAAMACLRAIENGYQAALLAPTEVLAEQHSRKLGPLLEQIGITVVRLQGSMKPREKKHALELISTGQASMVIGTHALFQDSVEFANLALAVVDEQHRFGVGQRLKLISKAQGGHLAHQLMMSATPIPRTLAQTFLSDLAVSNLDEKPPGRKPILTKLLSQSKREQLMRAIELEASKGHQIYWVCPLIEESEDLDLQAAENTFQELTEHLSSIRIGLLHGKLDPQVKQQTMDEFAKGNLDLLVATTVIEVGVDVSNASLMVIDQAERFGLAQLHQLRGRVGRGQNDSVCILLFGNQLSHTAKTRLKAMHESDDGFYLAEVDLELRGPGELLGRRQSGLPGLRYADPLADKDLFKLARSLAEKLPRDLPAVRRHILRWSDQTPWWLS